MGLSILNNIINYKTKCNVYIIGLCVVILIIIVVRIYNTSKLGKLGKLDKISNNQKISGIEHFANPEYQTLKSQWDNGSGFYSELHFKLNHYLYAKKYNLDFVMVYNNWPYTFENGWTDYFEDVKLESTNKYDNKSDNKKEETLGGCCKILEHFPLRDYIKILPEFYKYNTKIKNLINNKTQELGLVKGQYGAIYIRRGDKLVEENNYNDASKFVDMLLDKYPDCNLIFVQTDDYNSYLEAKDYVHNKLKRNDIKLITLCPDNVFGAVAHSGYTERMKAVATSQENKEYMEKIKTNLSKPIAEMNPQEKFEHTLELLISVDICNHSKVTVCDFESNVSRFIKLAHDDFNAVIDINGDDKIINLDTKVCMGFPVKSDHQKI